MVPNGHRPSLGRSLPQTLGASYVGASQTQVGFTLDNAALPIHPGCRIRRQDGDAGPTALRCGASRYPGRQMADAKAAIRQYPAVNRLTDLQDGSGASITTLHDLLYVALFAVALPLWDSLVSCPAFHRQSQTDPLRARRGHSAVRDHIRPSRPHRVRQPSHSSRAGMSSLRRYPRPGKPPGGLCRLMRQDRASPGSYKERPCSRTFCVTSATAFVS